MKRLAWLVVAVAPQTALSQGANPWTVEGNGAALAANPVPPVQTPPEGQKALEIVGAEPPRGGVQESNVRLEESSEMGAALDAGANKGAPGSGTGHSANPSHDAAATGTGPDAKNAGNKSVASPKSGTETHALDNTGQGTGGEFAPPVPPSKGGLSGLTDTLNAMGISLLFLVGLGFGGWWLVKLKRSGKLQMGGEVKTLSIVATLPLGPKRSLMVVRVRNQELVLANTEAGVTLLTPLADSPQALVPPFARGGKPSVALDNGVNAFAREASQLLDKPKAPAAGAMRHEKVSDFPAAASPPKPNAELLRDAVKSLRERQSEKNVPQHMERTTEPTRPHDAVPDIGANGLEAPRFTRQNIQTYGEESRKTPQSTKGSFLQKPSSQEENVESVTNLIREKLREMKSL